MRKKSKLPLNRGTIQRFQEHHYPAATVPQKLFGEFVIAVSSSNEDILARRGWLQRVSPYELHAVEKSDH